jgi:hypothetical protein
LTRIPFGSKLKVESDRILVPEKHNAVFKKSVLPGPAGGDRIEPDNDEGGLICVG